MHHCTLNGYMQSVKFKNILPLIYQSLGRLLAQGLSFIIGVLMVRYLGLNIYGEYSKYNALVNISFGVFATGIYNVYLRENKIEILRSSLIFMLYLFLVFVLLLYPLNVLVIHEKLLNLFLFLLMAFFMRLMEFYVISMRFVEKDFQSIIPRVLPYVLSIILMVTFKPLEISKLLILFILSWSTVLLFFYQFKGALRNKPINGYRQLKATFFLTLITLATQIYSNVDQLMISSILNDEKLGIYKLGISFSVVVMPLISVFSFVYLSTLKKTLVSETLYEVRKTFYSQLLTNSIVSIFFVLLCFFFLDKTITFIYGFTDPAASEVGVIMALGVLFNVMSMVISYALLAIGKDREILVIVSLGAVINIVLNYSIIPALELIGAAWSSVFTQFVILILFLYEFYFRTRFFLNYKSFL